VPITENFFGPQVHAALPRKTMGEFDHGNALWPKKQTECDDPQPNRNAAVGRNGGKNVQVEDCHDKKQNEVPTAQSATQGRESRSHFFITRRGGLIWQLRLDFDHSSTWHYCPASTNAERRSCCTFARPGATSSKAAKCLSMSASVCCTEIVHCSSHQKG